MYVEAAGSIPLHAYAFKIRKGNPFRYRPSDHRLSEKLVATSADRGCHVFNVTDPQRP
jgi:hypothetical protein